MPYHLAKDRLEKIQSMIRLDPSWANHNREVVNAAVERGKQGYYKFTPYFNRRDGKPSWQWKFLQHATDSWGRVAYGGNRIGKSEMGAYEAVLAVTGEHPFRTYPKEGIGWIIGKDLKITKNVDLKKFEMLLPKTYKTAFKQQDNVWICHNESAGRHWEVHFRTAEAGRAAFQGDAIDWAWFDEEPMPTKQDVWTEVITRLADRRGIWWMTATPVLGTIWMKNLIESEGVVSMTGASWDNPYVPMEELKKLEAAFGEDDREIRLEGRYVVFGGKPVFRTKILNRILTVVRADKPASYGKLTEVAA